MMMTSRAFESAYAFLQDNSARSIAATDWADWLKFRKESNRRQWLYLYRFSPAIFAWGTTTGASDRLRRASMFNPQLTGKYDRRVDYLMLKVIHGAPRTWVFECRAGDQATGIEGALRHQFGQSHCYGGFRGTSRPEISREIHADFQRTPHYRALSASVRNDFEHFMTEVFYASRKHPKNPRRTFFWGDSLEPGFLRVIELGHLEPALEAALRVTFSSAHGGVIRGASHSMVASES